MSSAKQLYLAKAAMMLVAFVSISVVIAHMSCIWLGPECFAAQRAPLSIVESSRAGTWIAPVGTAGVSLLFLISGLYALSGGQVITKLPLLNVAIYTIATVCIARAIIVIPLLLRYEHLRSRFEVIACIIWFLCGVLLVFGHRYFESTKA